MASNAETEKFRKWWVNAGQFIGPAANADKEELDKLREFALKMAQSLRILGF